jgi:hypothetical protein
MNNLVQRIAARLGRKIEQIRAEKSMTDRQRARFERDERDAAFANVAPIELLSIWKVLAQRAFRGRWAYPHFSFTCKGPGLKHIDGPNATIEYAPIHKALTKRVCRSYTQNKTVIRRRESAAKALALLPGRSDLSEQDWLALPAG